MDVNQVNLLAENTANQKTRADLGHRIGGIIPNMRTGGLLGGSNPHLPIRGRCGKGGGLSPAGFPQIFEDEGHGHVVEWPFR